jgi:hypothetical protein
MYSYFSRRKKRSYCCDLFCVLQYPSLLPGQEEFVYESCTPLNGSTGSVEGSFTFVPGRYALTQNGSCSWRNELIWASVAVLCSLSIGDICMLTNINYLLLLCWCMIWYTVFLFGKGEPTRRKTIRGHGGSIPSGNTGVHLLKDCVWLITAHLSRNAKAYL